MRVVVLVVFTVLPLLADGALPEGASLAIMVQEVRGEAEVRFDERSAWRPVVQGMAVPVGSTFCTGADAFVWLAFGANSVALIRESTLLRIDAFGMEGDTLVARVHVDPGVTSFSVVQREQFLTSFEVSTPRLTASIRGSGETVIANGDEVPDRVFADEHFADVVLRSGQLFGVAQGGATNSNGQAPYDLATIENLADVTPEGATDGERGNAQTLSTTSQSTDVVGSNLTFSPTSNPVAAPEGPAPRLPEQHALVYDPDMPDAFVPSPAEQLHDLGHFILQVGDIETDLSRDHEEFGWRWERVYLEAMVTKQVYPLPDDGYPQSIQESYVRDVSTTEGVPPEWDAPGEWSEANHPLLHEMGVQAFIEGYLLPMIERDAHHDGDPYRQEWLDPETREAMHADFHHDAYGEGFDRFAENLRAAAVAASRGELEREMLGRTLLDVAHMTWHMGRAWEEDGQERPYEERHAIVHDEYMAPLLDKLRHGPFSEFVDTMLAVEHERWHGETGLPEELEAGTREAERHGHFHRHLDEMRETLLPPEP